ncbi:DUF975 family protein [Anaerocolumna sedimenticola]|uniref:DUF975 family protein n=1 Tax=Anaerocolumna sedimenticola TaxID=2696063 RepID=A0A6P1TSX3_9FIRM|nr:DUF975 family protein [Anaerocolumna sedimenticola]QHQ62568.1 DUF975 family protein [Anaerocolumna sedimenticola]
MIHRSEMKKAAKAQIKGNIGILFVCQLVISLISTLAAPVFLAGILIAPSFALSTIMIYIALTQNIRPAVSDIWKGFKVFGKALWLTIITGFFTFAWSLLFIIPGIVKGYAYLMAPYILADNPGMTAREALRESKRMTNGHKFELFVLNLSFIGWLLLIPLTLGLIVIWLAPYTHATLANYYIALKEDKLVTTQSYSEEH